MTDISVTPALATYVKQQMDAAQAAIAAFNEAVALIKAPHGITTELAAINCDTGTLSFHVAPAPTDG